MTFQELGLDKPILRALAELGYEKPSPIQEKAIPPALAGRDVLGCAQTGTGKTCAFAAPILQELSRRSAPGRPIRSLILTPTRELALQIQESFEAYGKYLPLRSAVIFGGVGQQPQVDKLKKGVDILVATPGRLLDLQGQGLLDLSGVEIFVLDEADRMLDMGFIHDVRRVLRLLPAKKQTLFFSATMPPEVMDLVNGLLHDPVKVAVDPISSPVEVIDQSVYFVDKGNKTKLLSRLLLEGDVKNALVFTRTKHGANKVAGDLQKAGITAAAIHGNKSQTARQQALADFETYVHRIGRTGRAGRGGTAVSFCDFGEQEYLRGIEKLIGRKVPVVEDHPWPMQVFEAPRDAKGRPVNADDAEARQAARERRRERAAAEKRAAQAAPAAPAEEPPAPGETPAKKRRRRKKSAAGEGAEQAAAVQAVPEPPAPERPEELRKKPRRGVRQHHLEDTLPAQPAQASSDFYRPDPLAGDVIMDATARLLASRRHLLPEREGRRKQEKPPARGQEKREKKPAAQGGEQKQKKGTPSAAPRKEEKPQPGGKKRSRGRGHGRRGGPPEVVLRTGNQKDSTEQPSLMKPYYMTPDD